MINDHVYEWLKSKGFEDRLTEHSETIDTVEHAAQQIGCSEAEIAKTRTVQIQGAVCMVDHYRLHDFSEWRTNNE